MSKDSDCKFAGDINSETGLRWCNKFNQYMRKDQEESCQGYEKA